MSANDVETDLAFEANVSCAELRPLPHKADERATERTHEHVPRRRNYQRKVNRHRRPQCTSRKFLTCTNLPAPGPDREQQNARFSIDDLVHMSQIMNGQRVKGVFKIQALQYNSRGDYVEYQLRDPLTDTLHRNGAWIRERDLKIERRG